MDWLSGLVVGGRKPRSSLQRSGLPTRPTLHNLTLYDFRKSALVRGAVASRAARPIGQGRHNVVTDCRETGRIPSSS